MMIWQRNRGFTLVELLVAIAFGGVMLGLLIPAVQMARESSRRNSCANNLKQIGLACHLFEGVNGHFPPGYLGPRRGGAFTDLQATTWISSNFFLLPHLEQSNAYNRIKAEYVTTARPNSNKRSEAWWLNVESNPSDPTVSTITSALSVCRCPSDSSSESYTENVVTGMHVWSFNTNTVISGSHTSSSPELRSGTANYFGSSGLIGDVGPQALRKKKGVFFNRSRTRLAEIVDGLSNTSLYGEVTGVWNNRRTKSERTSSYHWLSGLVMSMSSRDSQSHYVLGRFDSLHPGIIQYAFADGSVQAISKATNPRLLVDFGSIAGAEVNGGR